MTIGSKNLNARSTKKTISINIPMEAVQTTKKYKNYRLI